MENETTRDLAIKAVKNLIANVPALAPQIESFALANLERLLGPAPPPPPPREDETSMALDGATTANGNAPIRRDSTTTAMNAQAASHQSRKDSNASTDGAQPPQPIRRDSTADGPMLRDSTTGAPTRSEGAKHEWTKESAGLCCYLYFALCADNSSLLPGLVSVYERCRSRAAQAYMRAYVEPLVKALGMANPDLLGVLAMADAPADHLLLKMLHVLTESEPPTSELVETVKMLYVDRENVRFLVPILSGLTKSEVIAALPQFLALPEVAVKGIMNRLLDAEKAGRMPITPGEFLMALHELRPTSKDDQKSLLLMHKLCFTDHKAVFTPEVLGVVINQLVDTVPIPTLFMRTVIMSVQLYSKMAHFVISVLSRLVNKAVWNNKNLWTGWIKCCTLLQPQSFPLLLQLPVRQLDDVCKMHPELKQALTEHARAFSDDQQAQISRDVRQLLELTA